MVKAIREGSKDWKNIGIEGMKSEKTIATGIVFILATLMLGIFVGTVSAAFYPDGFMGTVIEKDTKNNTFEIQTEYKWWNDEWQANSTTLKWIFPNENAMNEINVGDYVEILGFPEPSGWTIGLEKMKSGTEKVITDIYGDPYFLEPYSFSSFPENPDPPLLGNYKIEYNNTANCSTWPGLPACNCQAEYTNVSITDGSGQVDSSRLYPGESYVHEGGMYRVNITFLYGEASAYPECTDSPCFGPQPISSFVIHIEETLGQGWSEDIRITNDSTYSINPRIAVDSNNNVHIVWEDNRDGNYWIYYTKLDNQGNTLIDDKQILSLPFIGSNELFTYDAPSIALDSNDNIHLAFIDYVDSAIYEVFYVKLDNNGTILGDIKRVDNNLALKRSPDIAVDSDNNVHIVWEDYTDYPTEVYYSKLDSSGNIIINSERLTYDTKASGFPKIAVDSSNNIHVVSGGALDYYFPDIAIDSNDNRHNVWCSEGNPQWMMDPGIYYKKLDKNGNTVIYTKLIIDSDNATRPAIANDSNDNIHVIWLDSRGEKFEHEIYYTKLDNAGNKLINDTQLTFDPASPWKSDIAIDSNDKVHITWQDEGDGNWEIYYKSNEIGPTVEILIPAGSTVFGEVTIYVDGRDSQNNALHKIEYYIDGNLVYTDLDPQAATPASTFVWSSGAVSDGTHIMKVIGYDTSGLSCFDEVLVDVDNSVVKLLIISDTIGGINLESMFEDASYVEKTVCALGDVDNLDTYDAIALTSNSLSNAPTSFVLDLGEYAEDNPVLQFTTPDELFYLPKLTDTIGYDGTSNTLHLRHLTCHEETFPIPIPARIDWYKVGESHGNVVACELGGPDVNAAMIVESIGEGKIDHALFGFVNMVSGPVCYISLPVCKTTGWAEGGACWVTGPACGIKVLSTLYLGFEPAIEWDHIETMSCDWVDNLPFEQEFGEFLYEIDLENMRLESYDGIIDCSVAFVWDESGNIRLKADAPSYCGEESMRFPLEPPADNSFTVCDGYLQNEARLRPPAESSITLDEEVTLRLGKSETPHLGLDLADNELQIYDEDECLIYEFSELQDPESLIYLTAAGLHGVNVYSATLLKIVGFQVFNDGQVSVGDSGEFDSLCPVDLTVRDPSGLVVSKQVNDVLGALYRELDMDGDQEMDDQILIPVLKLGTYEISVSPEPAALPTDTYTLKVTSGGTTIVLAKNVSISAIPDKPYIIESTETGIIDRTPPVITIYSPVNGTIYPAGSVNLNYSVSEPTVWEGYSSDGAENVTLYGNTTLTGLTEGTHTVTVYANDTGGNMGHSTVWFTVRTSTIFDTGSPSNPYPSISGMHKGTITLSENITVHKLYTYPCEGTGGHTEYVRIYGNGIDKNASWNGYNEDWQYIYFDNSFVLEEEKTYNYTIITGSYPQIIHAKEHEAKEGGNITCSEFMDANGKRYSDWIPAIRLE
ncbi:MAG: hypothetical protein C4B56_02405 [Candidatus Methanophagaceae archaeon]|nr:MAG: hypothetical protein C4B56_02405 [Methanophagales archaeon]